VDRGPFVTAYKPTVKKLIELPAGVAPRQVTCSLRLYASTTGDATGNSTGDDVDVMGVRTVSPDGSGLVTFTNVRPNSGSSTTVITVPSGTVYELATKIPGRPVVTEYLAVPDGAGPYWVQDILTAQPSDLPVSGSPTSAQSRLAWAANPDVLVFGTLTRNGNGVVTSATVTWPDGVTGTYTATVDGTYGTVVSYVITYGSTTYTQPTMTLDANGFVTTRPAITVS
jgi:hypothetical protein